MMSCLQVDGMDVVIGDSKGQVCRYNHSSHQAAATQRAENSATAGGATKRGVYVPQLVVSEPHSEGEEITCLSVWQRYCVYATSSGSVTAMRRPDESSQRWERVALELPGTFVDVYLSVP